jgi:hypothetical protein
MAELAHEARMTRHLGVPTDDWLVIFICWRLPPSAAITMQGVRRSPGHHTNQLLG